jgi:hypothetical protein
VTWRDGSEKKKKPLLPKIEENRSQNVDSLSQPFSANRTIQYHAKQELDLSDCSLAAMSLLADLDIRQVVDR